MEEWVLQENCCLIVCCRWKIWDLKLKIYVRVAHSRQPLWLLVVVVFLAFLDRNSVGEWRVWATPSIFKVLSEARGLCCSHDRSKNNNRSLFSEQAAIKLCCCWISTDFAEPPLKQWVFFCFPEYVMVIFISIQKEKVNYLYFTMKKPLFCNFSLLPVEKPTKISSFSVRSQQRLFPFRGSASQLALSTH